MWSFFSLNGDELILHLFYLYFMIYVYSGPPHIILWYISVLMFFIFLFTCIYFLIFSKAIESCSYLYKIVTIEAYFLAFYFFKDRNY